MLKATAAPIASSQTPETVSLPEKHRKYEEQQLWMQYTFVHYLQQKCTGTPASQKNTLKQILKPIYVIEQVWKSVITTKHEWKRKMQLTPGGLFIQPQNFKRSIFKTYCLLNFIYTNPVHRVPAKSMNPKDTRISYHKGGCFGRSPTSCNKVILSAGGTGHGTSSV